MTQKERMQIITFMLRSLKSSVYIYIHLLNTSVKLTQNFINTVLEYHRLQDFAAFFSSSHASGKQVLQSTSLSQSQVVSTDYKVSLFFLPLFSLLAFWWVLTPHHDTVERNGWSFTLWVFLTQTPRASFPMFSTWVLFLYSSKINKLNGIKTVNMHKDTRLGSKNVFTILCAKTL